MSEKLRPQHLARKAILYVRQSSAYQVAHNLESQKLQYAMERRLRDLGWTAIEIIDEDLGRSASGAVERTGFERMVSEVCLGHVGAVAAREVSRFARNSRDWQQLIEVCRLVDTVLIDQETVYVPRQSNDRLLLGLKGSLNEYELELLRQRSLDARLEKARRGELLVAAPIGYRKGEGRLEKDPDRRVQETIALVFRKCLELGSARQTLHWFIEEGVQLPGRDGGGLPQWKRATYASIHRLLTNPAYGGAYVYGRSGVLTEFEQGRSRRCVRRRPREQWLTLKPGAHEGYVEWAEFERIGAMIANNNRGEGTPGAPKRGEALLAGLVRCGRCGRKLMVHYTGSHHDVLRYGCLRGNLDQGEPRCITFGGSRVDQAVSAQVLQILEPAAVEAAVQASTAAASAGDEVRHVLERELEAARYAATRAWKQYDATDPENRLVADELERRWNRRLEDVRAIEARLAERREGPVPATREEFQGLAEHLATVWNHPEVDVRLKKRIVRTLIEEVVVDLDPSVGEIVAIVHWKGGVHTEIRLPRRRRGHNSAQSSKHTIEAVRILARICSDDLIAGALNRSGVRTGRGNRWTRERIASLRSYHQIACYSEDTRESEGWLNLTTAAGRLGISPRTLRLAVERGEIPGDHPLADGPWVFNRRDLDSAAARGVVERVRCRNAPGAVPPSVQSTFTFSST
jgi:DNA invertase Pin-like site-specific DNA recombinase